MTRPNPNWNWAIVLRRQKYRLAILYSPYNLPVLSLGFVQEAAECNRSCQLRKAHCCHLLFRLLFEYPNAMSAPIFPSWVGLLWKLQLGGCGSWVCCIKSVFERNAMVAMLLSLPLDILGAAHYKHMYLLLRTGAVPNACLLDVWSITPLLVVIGSGKSSLLSSWRNP